MRNTTFFSKNKKYPVDSSKFFTKTAAASISINSFVRKEKKEKTSSFSFLFLKKEKDSLCNYK